MRQREAVCERDRGRERERPPSPSITPAPADGECARGGERDRVCVTAITNHSTCDHRQCVCEREWVGESVREGERERETAVTEHSTCHHSRPPRPCLLTPCLPPPSFHPQVSTLNPPPRAINPPSSTLREWLIDCVHHSTLGVREITQKKCGCPSGRGCRVWSASAQTAC